MGCPPRAHNCKPVGKVALAIQTEKSRKELFLAQVAGTPENHHHEGSEGILDQGNIAGLQIPAGDRIFSGAAQPHFYSLPCGKSGRVAKFIIFFIFPTPFFSKNASYYILPLYGHLFNRL
jgi:hypothetical protein